jgi:hypothetical protein
MATTPNERELSRKERARQIRRAAYLRAKERRATDPRFLAMKEAAKRHRREAYQVAKDRVKTARAAKKHAQKEKDETDRAAKRVAADEKLRSKVRLASKPQ